MSLLSDLINMNLSDSTDKIIAEYICTKSMREEGGMKVIKAAIEKLGLRHREHIEAYGTGNERRLTGRHETADINTFVWCCKPWCINQGLPYTENSKNEAFFLDTGCFENRRPASNMDPYNVTSMIA